MKQLSFFTLGLLLSLLVGCQSGKRHAVPTGWQPYKIVQDTAIATFALPPDIKPVNYFFFDSSELYPGVKGYLLYDLGFKSKDFELSASLNPFPGNALHWIKTGDWGKDAPYTKRKIAGREFWVREKRTNSVKSWADVVMYYIDYIGAGDNHFHIDFCCYETAENKEKAERLITEIAQTIDVQVRDLKKNISASTQEEFVEYESPILNRPSLGEKYNPGAYGAGNIVTSTISQDGNSQRTSLHMRAKDKPGQAYLGFVVARSSEETAFLPADVAAFAQIRDAHPCERDKRLADALATTIGPTYIYRLMSNNASRFTAITKETLAQLEADFMQRINAVGPGANQEGCFVATYMLDPRIEGAFNLYRSERKYDGSREQYYKLDISSGNPVWRPIKKE